MNTSKKQHSKPPVEGKPCKSNQLRCPFITKLYQILQDKECTEHITWNTDGDMFHIADVRKFTDIVLPRYFKHKNYSSFVRLLNMYGFHKIKSGNSEVRFFHEKFKREGRSMNKIQRCKLKRETSDDEDDEDYVDEGGSEALTTRSMPQKAELDAMQDQITNINNKFEGLKTKTVELKEILVKQNDNIKAIYAEMIHLKKEEDKKLSVLLKQLGLVSGSVARDSYFRNESNAEKTFESYNQPSTGNLKSDRDTRATIRHDQNGTLVSQIYDQPQISSMTSNKTIASVDFTENQIRYNQKSDFADSSDGIGFEPFNQNIQHTFQIPRQNFAEVPSGLRDVYYFGNEMQTADRDFFYDPFFEGSKRCEENFGANPYKKVQKRGLIDTITNSEQEFFYV